MEPLIFAGGVLLLWLVFWDLFQSIVLPRPSPSRFRIARFVIRVSWRLTRALGGREGPRRERWLGYFAPAITLVVLAVWLATLMLGYGLIFYALRDELRPVPADLGSCVYFAASCILTLGFGDIVAQGGPARVVAVVAAASGLGAVALVVTFLYSLFGSYQRRETQVVALQGVAGSPPSAIAVLESYRRLEMPGRLPELFLEWERWAAEVLDTHVAYPLLGYFRSSHDNLTWIGALGAVLDAATLVVTTIENDSRGEAERFRRVGAHLVEDISNVGIGLGTRARVGAVAADRARLDESAFNAAYARLAAAGYRLVPRDRAWPAFQAARGAYAVRLEAMAAFWDMRSSSLLGEEDVSAVHV